MEIYKLFQQEIGILGELQQKDCLKLLEKIENHLNIQLKTMKQFRPDLVKQLKEEYEKKRIIIYKEEKEKEKRQLIEQKNQRNLQKIQQPIKKKTGRTDMKRSSPFEKVIEEVEVEVN